MNNMILKQGLSSEQLSMVNSEVEKRGKSKAIAYVLWLFLGVVGGHRFYNGNIGMGIGMILTLGGLGLWTIIDVFFIGKAIESTNEEIEQQAIMMAKATQNSNQSAE